MPLVIIGGEGSRGPKRSISKIGGEEDSSYESSAKESAPRDEGGDVQEQRLKASEQVLSAISRRDAERLSKALQAFYMTCEMDDGESETEDA